MILDAVEQYWVTSASLTVSALKVLHEATTG